MLHGTICALLAAVSAGELPLVPYPRSVKPLGGEVRQVEIVRENDPRLGAEEYRLRVAEGKAVIVSSTAAGAFYAGKTLEQLRRDDGSCPAVEIEDGPKFPWRGFMIDDARHFFGREAVLKTLEQMAKFKLNVLHWHLTDDQGWRLPVPGYPKLTEGRRPMRNDIKFRDPAKSGEYGPCFYTKAELREIVARAEALHIRIVPEIEIPGHSYRVLEACPEFACTPTGGVSRVKDVCCVGKDATLRFFERVLDEVIDIFPGEIIHIGGDECNREGWAACRDCRARMAKEGIGDFAALQAWTTAHFERYLAAKGRHLMGWDEIAEGGLPSGAMVMSWRGASGGIAAAKTGHNVVMTPTEFCYWDYEQGLADDPEAYPYNWALVVPVAKVYRFDPLRGIPAEYRGNVFGAQGNNWSEMTFAPSQLEWKIWPRALAFAEVLWTYPDRRDFEGFVKRASPLRDRMCAEGVNAAPLRIRGDSPAVRGTLEERRIDGGSEYVYTCGKTRVSLTLRGGELTCVDPQGTVTTYSHRAEFSRRLVEAETFDLGQGVIMLVVRPAEKDWVVEFIFDGENFRVKDRLDCIGNDD